MAGSVNSTANGSTPGGSGGVMWRAVRGFIIGSSLPATIWPLAGLGFASRDLPVGTLDWFFIGFFFPVLFGVTNAVTAILPGRMGLAKMLGSAVQIRPCRP